MFEVWIPIEGFPGYEVSDLGRVRSLPRTVPNRGTRGGRMRVPGRILRTQIHKGYRQVTLQRDGSSVLIRVHKEVCRAFHGPDNGLWALHKDGDSLNNLATNLYWGTPSQNQQDSVRHGTHRMVRDA